MTRGDPTEPDLAEMRALHREASDHVDAKPDPRVRAAVLAEATKAAAGRTRRTSGNPFGTARWPLSMAAVLVVSVMAGLVATRTMQDQPERVAPVVAAAPPATPGSNAREPAVAAEPARSGPPMDASSDRIATPRFDEARTHDAHRPKTAPPPAPSSPAAPPAETRAAMSIRAEAAFAQRLDAAASPTAAAPRQAPAGDAPARRSGSAKASGESSTPEAWVERIISLRAAGWTEEADRELAALRLRYPDFAIPQAAIGTR